MHRDLPLAQHPHHGLPGQPVQKAVRQRGMHFAILDKEDVGTGRLGDITAIVEHHGVGTAIGLCRVFRHGADHVKARGFGVAGDGFGAGAFPLGDIKLGTLHLGVAVVVAPFPRRHRHAYRVEVGGDAHHFPHATPGDGADIGIGETIGLQHGILRRFDLIDSIRDFHVEHPARGDQPFRMLAALENLAIVAPLTLKHRAGIVHRMGQDMHIGAAPIDQFAIHPDLAVTVIIGTGHRHSPASTGAFLHLLRNLGPVRTYCCAKPADR